MVTVETGNLTPGVVSVREGYTGDCGYVIPGAQTIVVGSHVHSLHGDTSQDTEPVVIRPQTSM